MPSNALPSAADLAHNNVWLENARYEEAENEYQALLAQRRGQNPARRNDHAARPNPTQAISTSSISSEIANAREKIKSFLNTNDANVGGFLAERMEQLEIQNRDFLNRMVVLEERLAETLSIITKLETALNLSNNHLRGSGDLPKPAKDSIRPAAETNGQADDDDIDLFGSDEETEEESKLKAERVKAYEEKKAKKTAVIAKSSVILDVKPWSDDTDMVALEAEVRKIELDGLKWGAGKLVPLAYGIKKLQIIAIVEDDKVSIDLLQELIQELEDYVQSVDIAAFNKL